MPRYMLLIYDDEQAWAALPPQDVDEMMRAYYGFDDVLRSRGALVAGEPLQPTATATTVTVVGGEAVATDGPYAQTKEQLSGYYVVDAQDLDDAIELAALVPSTRVGGRVEVRPVLQLPDTVEGYTDTPRVDRAAE